ncbi:hypothetical protein, partial [Erwinia amylovora]|uniref:hypothetical protein n=1 Tax=Erwinia amylovora TaxID=552 RepID=UPI0039749347
AVQRVATVARPLHAAARLLQVNLQQVPAAVAHKPQRRPVGCRALLQVAQRIVLMLPAPALVLLT